MAALPQVSLFNTLTRRIEPLQPLAPPRVTLYTCGPTVWNFAHIGNFRTFLFEDLLRRWLVHAGYDVFHIMNLTDVDDRTIKAARQAGKSLVEQHRAVHQGVLRRPRLPAHQAGPCVHAGHRVHASDDRSGVAAAGARRRI
jgi:cysteinyl-tRNA synthetase